MAEPAEGGVQSPVPPGVVLNDGNVNETLTEIASTLLVLENVGSGDAFEAAVHKLAEHLTHVRKTLMIDNPAVRSAQAKLYAQLLEPVVVQERSVDLIDGFVRTLHIQEFECRKDVEAIVEELLKHTDGITRIFTVGVLSGLCSAYDCNTNGAVALNCGNIIRQGLQHEPILRIFLNHPETGPYPTELFEKSLFRRFFLFVTKADFEVASDALWTFHLTLTKFPKITAEYLTIHYDAFFAAYCKLLQNDNYVTRRQSTKILGELLTMRTNSAIMIKFVSSPHHLKVIMQLLRDPSNHIKWEAYHVFRLFIANPKKTQNIKQILQMNATKLQSFFSSFFTGSGSEAPESEKKLIMKEIESLSKAEG